MSKKVYHWLYEHRFEIFLTVQLSLLFGSLVIPLNFYERAVTPILYLLAILSGILIISKCKTLMWICIVLFAISLFIFGHDMIIYEQKVDGYILIRLLVYFILNIIVTLNIIKQVWQEDKVDRKVILGLISGYIALGFLGFFLFMSIDLTHQGAFTGNLIQNGNFKLHTESLLYYSFITLLTIGYGEIVPAIPIAQKAAILIGLIGQFYIAIITAVIVTKYIKHSIMSE